MYVHVIKSQDGAVITRVMRPNERIPEFHRPRFSDEADIVHDVITLRFLKQEQDTIYSVCPDWAEDILRRHFGSRVEAGKQP